MTVREFVEGYANAEKRGGYIDSNLKIAEYAPFNTKVAYAENIVKNTCLDENGDYREDSVQLDLMIDWSTLRIYTDLQLDPQRVVEEYDLLSKRGLLDKLIDCISDKTYEDSDKFSRIVYDKKSDLENNMYEIHHFIARCIMNLSPLVTPLLEQVVTLLSQVDADAITDMVKDKIGVNNDNENVTEAV